jgi:crotonobetainyl-CoA:carnitine CoA-transferase CaiB-like acyl-CoA transferase
MAARLLADIGAEIIKIEGPGRPDPTRGPKAGTHKRRQYPSGDPGEDPWNRVPRFNERHLGTRSVTLDLSTAEGREKCLDLVRYCDVVVENFSTRVLKKLGLTYDDLAKVKPDIILVSMPGFGSTGSWEKFVSYGTTLEHISGLASLTGRKPGDARLSGVMAPDYFGAVHGAAAILTGLLHRKRTGQGQRIELAQLESALCLVGEKLLDAARTGHSPTPIGNSDPRRTPSGCYPCREAGTWMTISVDGDMEWRSFCEVTGLARFMDDSRLATEADRKAQEAEIDNAVTAWTLQRDRYEATQQLQRAGIAAAVVMSARDHFSDPQIRAREMLVDVDHPSAGRRTYLANPWKGIAGKNLSPAPLFGQDNDSVLRGLLGLDDNTMEALAASNIIGTEPLS